MISVCIATYNGEQYIAEQISSILPQLSDEDELIISDDSSSDKTIEILESYNDSRISILKGNNFHSPIFNIENALKKAKGDLIFLSDQDDIWLDNKIQKIKSNIKPNSLIISDVTVVDENLNIIMNSIQDWIRYKKGFIANLIRPYSLGCCMAFDQKVLKTILPFPKNIPAHDLWISLLYEMKGNVLFINEPLMLYRRHGNNFSQVTEKSKNSFLKKIENRVILLLNVLMRLFF